ELRIDQPAALTQAFDEAGYANVSVIAALGDQPVVRDLTIYPDGTTSEDLAEGDVVETIPEPGLPREDPPGLDPLDPAGIVNLDVDLGTDAAPMSTVAAVPPVVYRVAGCRTQEVQRYRNRTVRVGTTAVSHVGGSQKFTFSSGAKSTLGTAMSYSGQYGGFSASGTATTTSSVTLSFPTTTSTTGSMAHEAYVSYAKYKVTCTDETLGKELKPYYAVRPLNFEGGARSVRGAGDFAIKSRNCSPLYKGTASTIDTKRATSWTNGVSMKGFIGFDLSAQSGYSHAIKVTSHAGGSGDARVCGSHGMPTNSVAGSIKLVRR
ncbi:MAG: hypothetical protein Q4G34_03780, partial [Micrococcus sp.]|nr:hypothetical protein [Micrococcus sp.]